MATSQIRTSITMFTWNQAALLYVLSEDAAGAVGRCGDKGHGWTQLIVQIWVKSPGSETLWDIALTFWT